MPPFVIVLENCVDGTLLLIEDTLFLPPGYFPVDEDHENMFLDLTYTLANTLFFGKCSCALECCIGCVQTAELNITAYYCYQVGNLLYVVPVDFSFSIVPTTRKKPKKHYSQMQ